MDIKTELGAALSPKSRLLLPQDDDFTPTGARWNCRYPINYSAIVDAAHEDDVRAAIKYANANNVPFFAFNGGHGAQLQLLKFQNGIGITTLAMKSLTLNDDDNGQTAWIRGSWQSGHLRDELYKLGKRTSHGSCDSTGLIGPMLGGGHGILQGRYGLLADQIVELRVVLADGSVVTVSEDSHKDLFWAMRGAGHNFGVVTAVRYKVYDVPAEDVWTQSSITFGADKLEELAKFFKEFLPSQPVELAVWFPQIMRIPAIDAANPVINIQSLYEGHESSNPLLAPLKAIGPLAFESKVVSWPTASDAIGWGWSSFSNKKGLASVLRFPVGLSSFDAASMRAVYDKFAAATAAQPQFGYSFVVWEVYATHAVKEVDSASTAVPDRADDMLVAPIVIYPGKNEALDAEAERLGQELRSILHKGASGNAKMSTYVNYAHGSESQEEVYGHDEWRLERLRKLKKEYDPKNKFGYYSPIV